MDAVEPTARSTSSQPGGEARRRVLAVLHRFPGLRAAQIARHAALEENLVRYHLLVLTRMELATESRQGADVRFFPLAPTALGTQSPVPKDDRLRLAVLRRPTPLAMVLSLLERPTDPLAMAELAALVGVSPSTATYHVGSLVRTGLVWVERAHRERLVRLVDPEATRRLLVRFPPPTDLVQGFVELWDRLEL